MRRGRMMMSWRVFYRVEEINFGQISKVGAQMFQCCLLVCVFGESQRFVRKKLQIPIVSAHPSYVDFESQLAPPTRAPVIPIWEEPEHFQIQS